MTGLLMFSKFLSTFCKRSTVNSDLLIRLRKSLSLSNNNIKEKLSVNHILLHLLTLYFRVGTLISAHVKSLSNGNKAATMRLLHYSLHKIDSELCLYCTYIAM